MFENILNVFFGTVRRAGVTLLAIAILWFANRPGDIRAIAHGAMANIVVPLAEEIFGGLVAAIGPIWGNIVGLAIFIFALRFLWGVMKGMLSGGGGKKRGRR